MKKLIFDTETAGLPSSWRASESDTSVWPRIVQIAWISLNENNQATNSRAFIVKPEGFSIPIAASNIHGITTERAYQEGINLRQCMAEFAEDLSEADLLIAHNIDFDYPVVNCELRRLNMKTKLEKMSRFCTMKSTTNLCNIEGPYGPKWPKLEELYRHLFGRGFSGAHDASQDVKACTECYVHLKENQMI